jgi:glutamyl-tRNA synthetase
LQGNVLLPEDAAGWLAVLGGDLPPLPAAEQGVVAEAGPEFFRAALAVYTEAGADFGRLARELKARTGRKGAGLFMPLRLALTGRHDGPELAALLPAIPEALVRARLANAARVGQD